MDIFIYFGRFLIFVLQMFASRQVICNVYLFIHVYLHLIIRIPVYLSPSVSISIGMCARVYMCIKEREGERDREIYLSQYLSVSI